MRIAATLCAALVLGGCVGTDNVLTESKRTLAKRVVDESVARQFPGVNVSPYSDCVIDNATGGEITRLASEAVTGVTDKSLNLVVEIATRPDTTRCLLGAGLRGAA